MKSSKNPGSILIVAIILGAIVMTLGLNLTRIFAKEIQFSSDLLFSEQAYFAAESGVEKSLIKLKNEPVENLIDHQIDFENGVKTTLNIENLKDTFSFALPPQENVKFRLRKDLDPTKETELESVNVWDLNVVTEDGTISGLKVWQWKILCSKNEKTLVIQNTSETGNFPQFEDQAGIFTDKNGESMANVLISDFFLPLSPDEKKSCFFSVTNISETETLDFTFESIDQMSPHQALITATGKVGKREKTIVFDYAQKKLGTLFDFVLFHADR